MKYKKGKGRMVRKLQKAWGRKTGGGRFSFKGGRKMSPFGNPIPVGLTSNDRVRQNLQRIGFRIGGDR